MLRYIKVIKCQNHSNFNGKIFEYFGYCEENGPVIGLLHGWEKMYCCNFDPKKPKWHLFEDTEYIFVNHIICS